MGTLTLRVGAELHAEWNQYCADNGHTGSDLLREFMKSRTESSSPPMKLRVQRKDQRKVQVNTWYTESELEGIRLRTMLNGGTRNAWIIKVVRSALLKQPVFDCTEADALREATAELSAIGKNLNQCARRLQEGQNNHGLDTDLVMQIRDKVQEVRRRVRDLVDANLERWEIRA